MHAIHRGLSVQLAIPLQGNASVSLTLDRRNVINVKMAFLTFPPTACHATAMNLEPCLVLHVTSNFVLYFM